MPVNSKVILKQSIKGQKKNLELFFIGFLLIPLGWALESFVHTFIFSEKTFFDNLMYPDAHELWMRIIFVVLITFFLFYVNNLFSKLSKAEKTLRENEIKLSVILESTDDGILAVDEKGKIIRSNKRFAELWEIPQDVIDIGTEKSLRNFVFEILVNPEEFFNLNKNLIESNNNDTSLVFFKNGKIFERFTAPMMQNDYSIGRVWSFRDITEKIKAKEHLEKLNEELLISKESLEESLFERNSIIEELIQTKEKLELTNAEKDKFFSIIAHDLKSPFQGLIGYSQILSTEYSTLTEDERITFITSIEELSRSSLKLLENLLDWSRIQTGQMNYNPERFDLLVELHSTFSLVKQTSGNKGIEFRCKIENPITIMADKNMLATIVRNLISNSIKFTHTGGTIEFEAKELEDHVEILISDTGVGMSEKTMNSLFKVDKSITKNGTANEKGTGIGLLLVKEMVEKHNGKVWLESSLGKGTTFFISIPYC